MDAQGGASLAPRGGLSRGDARRPRYVGAVRRRRASRRSTCRSMLAGKLASRVAVHRAVDARHLGHRRAGASSRPRCSCSMREFTAPGDDPDAFDADEAAARRRGRQPRRSRRGRCSASKLAAGQHVEPLHVAAAHRRARSPRSTAAKMLAFYRQRFSNAADFTFFMVGAFKVDEALPLLARTSAALPSTGQPTSHVQGRRRFTFPTAIAAREGREGTRAARPDASSASSPIRRSIPMRAGTASAPRPTCSRSRCATSCARNSARPTPCRSACPAAAAARRRPHRGQLRRRAREHRRR